MDLISNLQTTLAVAYKHDTTTKFTVDSITNWPADGVVRVDDGTEWALQRYDLLTVGPPKELDTLTDPKAIFESSGASGHEFAIGTTVTLVFTGDYLDELVPGTPILADGTQALTANWDAGAFQIRALTFQSDIATGNPPLIVASTTVIPHLNADMVDGHHFADAILAAGTVPLTAAWDAGSWQIRAETFRSDVVTGTPPFIVASTTKVPNLNAHYLDGSAAGSWVLVDGSIPLTGSWDAGAFQIRALTFYSDVVTGTAPLTIASTTVVANLNVDQVDGKDSTDLVLVDGAQPLTGNWDAGAFQIRALTFYSDVATGTAPLTVLSTTMVDNLSADLLDGKEATDFLLLDGTQVMTGDLDMDDNNLTNVGTIALDGGQIAFPTGVQASADPNTLDDYEEGAFDPVYALSTPGDSSWTMDTATAGRYTKIGDKVFIESFLRTDVYTKGTGTGIVLLTGLPFTSKADNPESSMAIGSATGWAANNHPLEVRVASNNTLAYLYMRPDANDGSANTTEDSPVDGGNKNYLYVSGFYTIA